MAGRCPWLPRCLGTVSARVSSFCSLDWRTALGLVMGCRRSRSCGPGILDTQLTMPFGRHLTFQGKMTPLVCPYRPLL